MTKRGSETRKKTRSVLVRLTEAEYSRLTVLAAQDNTSRADLLRRSFNSAQQLIRHDTSVLGLQGFPERDRFLLSDASRRIGHLAGLLKLAILKSPTLGPSRGFRSFLDEHRAELLELQRQVRALLERGS